MARIKRMWHKYKEDPYIFLSGDAAGIYVQHHGQNPYDWDGLKIFWTDPKRSALKGGDWLWVPRSGPMRYGNNWENRGFSTHLPDRLFVPSGLKHIIGAVRLMPMLPEVRKLHGNPQGELMVTFKTHAHDRLLFTQWAICRQKKGSIRVYWRG